MMISQSGDITLKGFLTPQAQFKRGILLVINVCSIRLGLIYINFEILYLQLGDEGLEERAVVGFL